MNEARGFGEEPLPQTVEVASAMRRMVSLLVSTEHEHPVVDDMVRTFAEWEQRLAGDAVTDPLPRMGSTEGRLYLRHAFDVWEFNPCFPEYHFDAADDEDAASGTVTFPLVFEGPPGHVHGGFLGVFFDCVVQQHNCLGSQPSGMTRTMTITYRRPVPLARALRFDITRTREDRGVHSTSRLLDGDQVLCEADVTAVPIPTERLAGFEFGART